MNEERLSPLQPASVCGINASVARKIVRDKFKKKFQVEFTERDLAYNKEHNRYDVTLGIQGSSMTEKDKKNLKEAIAELEDSEEFYKVFKVVKILDVSRKELKW